MDLIKHPFFFLCPACFSENTLVNFQCIACHEKIEIHKDQIVFGNSRINFADYYDLFESKLNVTQNPLNQTSITGFKNSDHVIRISNKAVLRQGTEQINFPGYHNLFQKRIEKPVVVAEGHLIFFNNSIEFISDKKRLKWDAKDITCVTTNGHYFEFKIKYLPFYQIHFLHESPLKYEIIFRKWLEKYYNDSGKRIIEFQPRLIFSPPQQMDGTLHLEKNWQIEKSHFFEKTFITVIEFIIRTLFRFWLKVRIISKENWESVRSGFTLLNHQSALDPFIVGAFLDRKIAFLTKSTSFTHWLPRFFLKWLMGIPTTRYQTDPEVIYFIRILLNRGIKIGIFPEGERTWGGKLHSFKLSLVKLLIASREAITPIVLQNAFQFWPRWGKWPRKTEVKIVVGAPFCLIPGIYSVDEQRKFLEDYFKMHLKEY